MRRRCSGCSSRNQPRLRAQAGPGDGVRGAVAAGAPDQVYSTLSRLEGAGLVRWGRSARGGRPDKRVFELPTRDVKSSNAGSTTSSPWRGSVTISSPS